MEVTKNNFKESLGLISQTIQSASFLAIDAEFTGLDIQGNSIHAFDTPEERYTKLIESAKTFIIVQFGLSAFQYNHDTGIYTANTFNFYVFPRSFSKQSPDVRFLCQSSSIDFLVSQGMDFGKIFANGISYLREADERKLREMLKRRHLQQNEHETLNISTSSSDRERMSNMKKGRMTLTKDQKLIIDNNIKRVDDFLNNSSEDSENMLNSNRSLDLDPCNSFLRKCLYEAIKSRFQSNVRLESKLSDKKQSFIRVSHPRTEVELKEMEIEELDDAVGFSKVINMISSSGKLVVGHNMLLDILHIIQQFCVELPYDYVEFKELTKCILPRLVDTKHMASSPPFKDLVSSTTLADLQKELEKSPFNKVQVECGQGFPSYAGTVHLHEAGYDAYLTGLCFISMTHYLGSKMTQRCNFVLPDSAALDPFKNRIHLMRIYDIPYVNLEGLDLIPSRDHVFHITFDRQKKASDILQLFSPFGNIQIVWLSDTSALVGLYRKDQAEQAQNALVKNVGHNGWSRVVTYSHYVTAIKKKTYSKTGVKRKLPESDACKGKTTSSELKGSSSDVTTMAVDEDDNTNDSSPDLKDEDLGEPMVKKLKEETKDEKTFEEPDEW